MAWENKLASAFQMSEEVWARHANPWSVWTRYLILPLFVIAVWSRVWIGWWSLLPIGLLIVWTWLNPRVFRKPRSTDNWASKAVLGERIWLKRKEVSIPEHHRPIINVLNVVSGIGVVIGIWGLITLSPWAATFGTFAVVVSKSWFLDRMVWLYDEMKDADPTYRSWLY